MQAIVVAQSMWAFPSDKKVGQLDKLYAVRNVESMGVGIRAGICTTDHD